jgi:hypothetical protein
MLFFQFNLWAIPILCQQKDWAGGVRKWQFLLTFSTINADVNFSSCQWNLIKTFQVEDMIAMITKMTSIFSSHLLNGQK